MYGDITPKIALSKVKSPKKIKVFIANNKDMKPSFEYDTICVFVYRLR